MEYKIMLVNGTTMSTTIEDIGVIEQMLENDKLRALTVGDMSISKNAFSHFIASVETGNVEILTSDGQSFLVQDDEYSAIAYSEKINSGKRFVRFGDTILQSHSYFMAHPVTKEG